MGSEYGSLALAASLPAIVAGAMYLIINKTKFGKINPIAIQVVCGIIFGCLAIIGTEWGVPFNGAQVNCRDAAVLSAGFIFGGPAGIIAGLIGGIERWIAVAWGIGTYTRTACTLSTIIAGLFAALLRKLIFEGKNPSWYLAFVTGIVMEVFHLTMVFLTNFSDTEHAISVVKVSAVPMTLANSVAVMAAVIVAGILAGDYKESFLPGKRLITQEIQKGLLASVVIAFVLSSLFIYSFQNGMAGNTTDTTLEYAIDDVYAELQEIQNDYDQGEISSDQYDIRISELCMSRHVGKTGFIFISEGNRGTVVSGPEEYTGKRFSRVADISEESCDMGVEEKYLAVIGDKTYYSMNRQIPDENNPTYTITAFYPEDEAVNTRSAAVIANTFMEVLVFALVFIMIIMLINKTVVRRMRRINASLNQIAAGNLDVVIDERSTEEFATLSDDINTTVDTLKRYIAEAEGRIDKELEFAKTIQLSSMPKIVFDRGDIDIYACMFTAKEVGGDFYDYYFTERGHLNILIADVSGKGIPASLFMMRAKTELRTLTEADQPLDQVFTTANDALCEGNDAGMFVTAWQAKIDLSRGKANFVNAGHNPPLVYRAGEGFSYLKSRAGLVLAGMEGMKYRAQTLDLEPGDIIFLYTDGVTEATDGNNQLYSEERLLDFLNSRPFDSMKDLCWAVKKDVDDFVGGAVQFDDITMLALKYNGGGKKDDLMIKEKVFPADKEALPEVSAWIEGFLEDIACPMKQSMQISVAVEEIFVNIASYAYEGQSEKGEVFIKLENDMNGVSLTFTDSGTKFNPLAKEDPDVSLGAEERAIGGLGIYMVKKTMDETEYRYEEGNNIFTIKKKI